MSASARAGVPVVGVYGSARLPETNEHYRYAVAVGRALAGEGFIVATGGYAGVMEAVSKGAREAGGEVIGYTVTSWDGLPANRYVTEQHRRTVTIGQHDVIELVGISDLIVGSDRECDLVAVDDGDDGVGRRLRRGGGRNSTPPSQDGAFQQPEQGDTV